MTSAVAETQAEETLDWVPVKNLKFNPNNPRKVFDAAQIKSLADSIEQEGQLQPMRVRADGTIIAGERRKRALDLLIQTKRLPADTEASCIIMVGTTEAEDQIAALIENIQRVDLTPLEEARGYYSLLDLDVRQADIAKRVGRSTAHVSKRLSLLTLTDEAQGLLDNGAITIEYALGLTGITDPKKQTALAKKNDEWALKNAITGQVQKAKVDKVVTSLKGLGLDVLTGNALPAPPEGTDWAQIGESVDHDKWKGSAPKGATAVYVTSWLSLRFYKLIDLPKGTVNAVSAAEAESVKRQKAQEKASAKAKADRETHLKRVGVAATQVSKAAVLSLLVKASLGYIGGEQEIGVALGIEPVRKTREHDGVEYDDYVEAVASYAAKSEINALRVLIVDMATDYTMEAEALAVLGMPAPTE